MADETASKTRSRSLHVLRWFVDSIRSGRYREGERLPTERELVERLGVGRSSIREALSILSALGVVNRHVGVGTHVVSQDAKILDRAVQVAQQEGDLRETYELQRILEVGIAESAARSMTPASLESIEATYLEMERAVSLQDIDAYFVANRQFHLSIVRATNNHLLEQEVSRLLDLMYRPLWHTVKEYLMRHRSEYLKRSMYEHARLLDAFRSQDTARARRLMEEHFERIGREIFNAGEE